MKYRVKGTSITSARYDYDENTNELYNHSGIWHTSVLSFERWISRFPISQ